MFGMTTVDFYDYEVLLTPVFDGRNSLITRLGNGKHREVRRTGYGSVRITFNLQSTGSAVTTTLSKLLSLEEASEDEFSIWFRYIADPTDVRTCILPRGQIPDAIAIAGQNSGLEKLDVEFLESTK
jgi:hypothetical protein